METTQVVSEGLSTYRTDTLQRKCHVMGLSCTLMMVRAYRPVPKIGAQVVENGGDTSRIHGSNGSTQPFRLDSGGSPSERPPPAPVLVAMPHLTKRQARAEASARQDAICECEARDIGESATANFLLRRACRHPKGLSPPLPKPVS